MPGPMDIYQGQGPRYSTLAPDVSAIIGNPAVIGASIAIDMFVLPKLATRRSLMGLAEPRIPNAVRATEQAASTLHQRYNARFDTGVPGTAKPTRGGVSWKTVQHADDVAARVAKNARINRFSELKTVLRRHGGASNAGFRSLATKATPAEIRKLGAAYGSKFANRLGMLNTLASFTHLTAIIGITEGAFALGGMIGDAISAYSPAAPGNRRRSLETGGPFVDTRHAQTQRMRSIQAIHNTQLSTRAAMGNEAGFMHLER